MIKIELANMMTLSNAKAKKKKGKKKKPKKKKAKKNHTGSTGAGL